MSSDEDFGRPIPALQADLESLIKRVVEATVAHIDPVDTAKPFITSRECARLIGVTPEHLCGMRARNEGPPWSGDGKWTRYERRAVVEWLANLPREKRRSNVGGSLSESSSTLNTARRQ